MTKQGYKALLQAPLDIIILPLLGFWSGLKEAINNLRQGWNAPDIEDRF